MRLTSPLIHVICLFALTAFALGQQNGSINAEASASNVPRLVPFNGTALDEAGRPIARVTGITFALYKEQQGGAPLWLEVQNVQPDADGKYSVQLGSSKTEGLPPELFASGDARWLGVQPEGQQELPRILLSSVPYAMKAKDSDTLGGLPPSAYLLAPPQGAKTTPPAQSAAGLSGTGRWNTASSKLKLPSHPGPVGGGGIAGYIPLWSDAATLTNSSLYQGTLTTSGNVGLKTTNAYTDFTLNGSLGFPNSPATMFYMNQADGKGIPRYSRMILAYSASSPNTGLFWEEPTDKMHWRSGIGREFMTADFVKKRLGVGPGTTSPAATLDVAGGGNARNGSIDTLIGDPGCGPGLAGLGFGTAFTKCTNYSLLGNGSNTQLNAPNGAIVFSLANAPVQYLDYSFDFSNNIIGAYSTFGSSLAGGLIGIAYDYGAYAATASYAEIHIADGGCGPSFIGFSAATSYAYGSGACDSYTLLNETDGVAGPTSQTFLNAGDLRGGGGTLHLQVDTHDAILATDPVNVGVTVNVLGTLTKQGGSFKIDHPLDPGNKYLYHSFVESPDMMNIYNGVVRVNDKGEATVALPEWFGALNRDFRYQLTSVGAPGPNLYVAEEVANNQFKIAGGAPGSKVSWQVTGIRQDAWANAHRIPTEEQKDAVERGHYLHPELFGQPEEASVQWAHNPDMMRRSKEGRLRPARRSPGHNGPPKLRARPVAELMQPTR